jgi:hypothetical protein
MRQILHALSKLEPLQDGPARRIQTVAAHFLARKLFPVEYECLQAAHGAKRGAARAGRAAADDCNVKRLHGVN